jgi:hypothetical protein
MKNRARDDESTRSGRECTNVQDKYAELDHARYKSPGSKR